jgi:hypothetical protein
VAFTSFIAWKLGLWEWRLIIPWVEGKEWQSLGRLLPGSAGRLAAGAVDAVALAPQLAALHATHLTLPLWLWVLAVGPP